MTPHPFTTAMTELGRLVGHLANLEAHGGGQDPALADRHHQATQAVVDAAIAAVTEHRRPTPAAPPTLSYEDVPGAPIPTTIDIDRIADHVTAKALIVADQRTASIGPIAVAVLTFDHGRGQHPLERIAEVTLALPPDRMRQAATILRDTLNAAANKAEGRG